MINQKSDLLIQNKEEEKELIKWEKRLHDKWDEKFFIKRIGEENIEITLSQRNEILKALNDGARFIQIGKYTLMMNSIKSIDPRYEPANIPPSNPYVYKPEKYGTNTSYELVEGSYKEVKTKVKILDDFQYKKHLMAHDLWKKMYGDAGMVLSEQALEIMRNP